MVHLLHKLLTLKIFYWFYILTLGYAFKRAYGITAPAFYTISTTVPVEHQVLIKTTNITNSKRVVLHFLLEWREEFVFLNYCKKSFNLKLLVVGNHAIDSAWDQHKGWPWYLWCSNTLEFSRNQQLFNTVFTIFTFSCWLF